MLQLTCDLLLINPDFYTLWNIRKTVLHVFYAMQSEEERHNLCAKELNLLDKIIPMNPKSYSSWYHRKYVLDHFCPSLDGKRELNLCDQFLNVDDRNCKINDKNRIMTEGHDDIPDLSFLWLQFIVGIIDALLSIE
jgi:geranylgeranyl transferase type-2 subunit alpha